MKIEIPFNHPIKELIWVVQDDEWIKIQLQQQRPSKEVKDDKEFHEYEIFSIIIDKQIQITVSNNDKKW